MKIWYKAGTPPGNQTIDLQVLRSLFRLSDFQTSGPLG
jgi:hypothetical protein